LINKFRNIKLDEFIIMPNHMHGIIFINIVGATPCGRPDLMDRQYQNTGQPRRVAPTMGDIMDWFKTMTTNDYISCVKNMTGLASTANYGNVIIMNTLSAMKRN